jgi:hypothetical protein
VLDNAILASMGEGLAGEAGNVDVAGEILSRDVLSQDDKCTTWPLQASQDPVTVQLVQDAGALWLHIQIPNLYVLFGGECKGLLSTIPIEGEMGGTIDVWSELTAKPTAGTCLTAFDHSQPESSIANWQFDVWGTGGPLQSWIVQMFAGQKSGEAKAQIQNEVATRADDLLGQKLSNISVFDKTSDLDLLGKPVSLHLCLTDLQTLGNKLVARIATSAVGGALRDAPGAPQVDGGMLTPAAKELVLDANLIGQLLYAAWRDNGLSRPGPDVDVGVLQTLIPGLFERHPNATAAQVTVDGELPPYVHPVPPGGDGDLAVEMGDLMVDLSVEGERILRFGVVLKLQLKLVPTDGKLMPMVIDSTAEVALLDELLDGPDAALEQAVQLQIGGAAAELLGSGAAIALPSLPGLGAPTDVVPDMGGRFLRVKLQ